MYVCVHIRKVTVNIQCGNIFYVDLDIFTHDAICYDHCSYAMMNDEMVFNCNICTLCWLLIICQWSMSMQLLSRYTQGHKLLVGRIYQISN